MNLEWNWGKSPFQIGDRVMFWYEETCKHGIPRNFPKGEIGTIIGHAKNGQAFAVQFDNLVWRAGNASPFIDTSCTGLGEQGYCWWMTPEYLLLVGNAFNGEVSVDEYL